MADEIIKTEKEALVSDIERNGVDKLLKPLIREIHLFDTFVSGTAQLEDPSVLDEVKNGDRLNLRRKADKFDEHTIIILTESGKKLGCIPEKDNIIFSRLMDAGKRLDAKIKNIEKKGSFTQIGIGIYLVDF